MKTESKNGYRLGLSWGQVGGLFGSLLVLSSATCFAKAEDLVLEVMAGEQDRKEVLVTWDLPASLADQEHFSLCLEDTGAPVSVQVDRTSVPRLVWILREPLRSGATRRYRLTVGMPSQKTPGGVTMCDDGDRVVAKAGGKPVLVYNQAVVPSPIADHPAYARSGYLHPVYNRAGQVVTDDFNPDHAHQHGIMFAWRKMLFEGRETNGWDQLAGKGRVEHVALEAIDDGPVFGYFRAHLRHVDLTAPGGPKAVLDERWLVKVYNVSQCFLFDIESTQTCASESPAVVEQCHYGGMTIRGSRTWCRAGQGTYDYRTSEGKGKTDGNQSRPHWVDLFGTMGAGTTGVAILSHPGNFRFPQPVRLHPTMPYFCFTPASAGTFTIEADKPYVSRYRYVVHQDALDRETGDRLWQDYAQPPEVRVVKPSCTSSEAGGPEANGQGKQ